MELTEQDRLIAPKRPRSRLDENVLLMTYFPTSSIPVHDPQGNFLGRLFPQRVSGEDWLHQWLDWSLDTDPDESSEATLSLSAANHAKPASPAAEYTVPLAAVDAAPGEDWIAPWMEWYEETDEEAA